MIRLNQLAKKAVAVHAIAVSQMPVITVFSDPVIRSIFVASTSVFIVKPTDIKKSNNAIKPILHL